MPNWPSGFLTNPWRTHWSIGRLRRLPVLRKQPTIVTISIGTMTFQWLQMRISEEKDRLEREAEINVRLPRALEELNQYLVDCITSFRDAFGEQAADLTKQGNKLRVVVRSQQDGTWQHQAAVDITIVPELPGFQIDRGGEPLFLEVGLLPGEKIFYRDRELDQYLTLEELTRRILDRAFFPKLKEL